MGEASATPGRITPSRLGGLEALERHGTLELDSRYKGTERWTNDWGKCVLRIHRVSRHSLVTRGWATIAAAEGSRGQSLAECSSMSITGAGRAALAEHRGPDR